MTATPIRSVRIPHDPPPRHIPLIPTVVVASYKGGVGKTALTVAMAFNDKVGLVRNSADLSGPHSELLLRTLRQSDSEQGGSSGRAGEAYCLAQ